MNIKDGQYIHATIHDFKNNISKYIRQLEREHYRAVVVYRRNKKVGVFIPYEPRLREVERAGEPDGG